MAAISHTFTERNTVQTNNTTTYAAVTGIAQASGSFTVGEKYLVIATAQAGAGAGAVFTDVHVIHGSTEFEGSLATINIIDGTQKETYSFMTVWTAVSSEGLSVEFRGSPTSGASNNTVNFVSLLSIQLSSVLTENTDWFFNESTADQALTTGSTQYDGGSITFTPGTASQNWLVLAHASYTRTSTTGITQTRLNQDSGTALTPLAIFSPNNSGAINTATLARVFNLPASSTNFKEQSMCATGAVATRTYSCVLALNLNKFAAYGQAYTDGDLTYTATAIATPDQLQTCSITPTQASDVWILSYHGFDKAVATYNNQLRVQVDNSDQPSGQTTAAYVFNTGHTGNSAADEHPRMLSTMVSSMTAAAHTIDLDGAVSNTTTSPSAQQRQLVAIQLEVAGVSLSGSAVTGGSGTGAPGIAIGL
jgi:hypothetical protein